MPHVPRRRLLFGAAGTALTLVALARTVDGAAIRDALGAASGDPLLLLVVAAVYTLAFWLRALAWRGLLTSAASTARLFSILQVSLFLNHVLPLRAGEVARPALAARHPCHQRIQPALPCLRHGLPMQFNVLDACSHFRDSAPDGRKIA